MLAMPDLFKSLDKMRYTDASEDKEESTESEAKELFYGLEKGRRYVDDTLRSLRINLLKSEKRKNKVTEKILAYWTLKHEKTRICPDTEKHSGYGRKENQMSSVHWYCLEKVWDEVKVMCNNISN